MRSSLPCLLILSAAVLHAAPRGTTVAVRADGTIVPTGAVVRITDLAGMAAVAIAQSQAAEAAAQASQSLSNEIARLEALIASRQQHAIFRGVVTSFSSVAEPLTNATAQIIAIDPDNIIGTNRIVNLGCWFSAAPTNAPNIEARASLLSGAWMFGTVVSNSWPDTYEVATTGGVWQAYAISVSVPAAWPSAFFRVNGNIQYWSGDDYVLPVYGALAVNGRLGLTTNIVCGAVTNAYEGGVAVLP